MKSIILICAFMLSLHVVVAQTPSEDPNFERFFEDDFGFLDRTKWKVYNRESWRLYFIDDPSTIGVSDGKLNLTAQYTPTGITPFTSGSIRSFQNFYPGTYFECKSKIPPGNNAYPSFWVWEGDGYCTDNSYREIDIMEWFTDVDAASGNLHFCAESHRVGPAFNYSISNPYSYHIYSCYWNKANILIQTDDRTVKEWTTPSKLAANSMKIENSGGVNASSIDPGSFPFTYQTEYINAYRLKQDCEAVITYIDFSSYIYKLKKSISLSGSTTVPSGGNISLRAVDYIELKDGFEVLNNTNFYLNTNECY